MIKEICAATMISVMSVAACAEWIKVVENQRAVYYVDPSTVRQTGETRKSWILQDSKSSTPDPNAGLSMRMFQEFNCQEEKMRILSLSAHSGHMLTGHVITNGNDASEWQFIPPGTPFYTTLKYVCSR